MESRIADLMQTLMKGSNDDRKAAEETLKGARKNEAQQLLTSLVQYVNDSGLNADKETQEKGCLAAILLKKQFLDDRLEEKECW